MTDRDDSAERPTGFSWRDFTPDDSPMTPDDLKADPHHRDLATAKLSVGDKAHGFTRPLHDFADGTAHPTGSDFDLLTESAERPVALIFGSYT